MTQKEYPIHPQLDWGNQGAKMEGLEAAEYAAIHLRVPKSGTPWLDEMISEANKRDLLNSVISGIVKIEEAIYPSSITKEERAAFSAIRFAAALNAKIRPD
jgi:hypothetical protein